MTAPLLDSPPTAPSPTRLWTPSRVLVTRSAAERPHGRRVLARLEAAGVDRIELLRGDRLPNLRGDGDRAAFMAAKDTLALVVPPPSKRQLQPIPPCADWRVDLAEGCPAHCQYCYLAGSLGGPPVTRVFADLDEILDGLDGYVGRGGVTSGTLERGGEGTTFEASCYTDPLAIEHLTGGLAPDGRALRHARLAGPVQLRATTKFDDVAALLDAAARRPHAAAVLGQRRVGRPAVRGRHRAGARPHRRAGRGRRGRLPGRAHHRADHAGAGWREEYGALLDAVARRALPAGADLTVECITHRFTPGSKETLLDWYPRTKLEMDEDAADDEARQVRRGQARLPEGDDDRAARLVRDRRRRPPARRPGCCTGRRVAPRARPATAARRPSGPVAPAHRWTWPR